MREDMAERLAALACKAMFDTSMVRGVGVAPPSATSSRTKKKCVRSDTLRIQVLRQAEGYSKKGANANFQERWI